MQDGIAYWAHAGDSRLFLVRGGRVVAQTKDHSRIRILVEEGLISEAQAAATHPDRNKIYSCLGSPTPPEIEFLAGRRMLEAGRHPAAVHRRAVGRDCPARHDGRITLKGANLIHTVPLLLTQAEEQAVGPHADNLSVVAVRWEENSRRWTTRAACISTQIDARSTKSPRTSRNSDATPPTSPTSPRTRSSRRSEEIRTAIDKFNPRKPGQ